MNDDLRKAGRKNLKEMFSIVEGVTVDDLKTDGITLRSGDKILKFEVVSEDTISIEDEIRAEVKLKLAEKMKEVKKNLNDRINNMMNLTKQVKEEAERKVREYKIRLSTIVSMPEISEKHAKKGLSVVKGDGKDCLVWLCRGVYWPKYVYDHGDDLKQIEPRYSKKMMSEVVFVVKTEGKVVKDVSTRQPIGLQKFQHYHQRTGTMPDCWGKWNWDATWSTPDDILKICKEAEAVLEYINYGSLAQENPRHLPQKASLTDHLMRGTAKPGGRVDTKNARLGITGGRQRNQDVWTA
jgi:hypothetical protein